MGLEIQGATHGTSVARTEGVTSPSPRTAEPCSPVCEAGKDAQPRFLPRSLPFPQPPALARAEEPHAAAGEGCPAPHAARPRPHVCGRSGGSSAPGHPKAAGAARGLSLRHREVSEHLQWLGSASLPSQLLSVPLPKWPGHQSELVSHFLQPLSMSGSAGESSGGTHSP